MILKPYPNHDTSNITSSDARNLAKATVLYIDGGAIFGSRDGWVDVGASLKLFSPDGFKKDHFHVFNN
jgi:hypothetical protein